MRRSHLKAVAAIHDLRLSDLSLKIINTSDDGQIDVTILTTNTQPGSLLSQLDLLKQSPMPDHELSNIKIFSSEDGQFALNIFTFDRKIFPSHSSSSLKLNLYFFYQLPKDLPTLPPPSKMLLTSLRQSRKPNRECTPVTQDS
jgi:hypothetical protein